MLFKNINNCCKLIKAVYFDLAKYFNSRFKLEAEFEPTDPSSKTYGVKVFVKCLMSLLHCVGDKITGILHLIKIKGNAKAMVQEGIGMERLMFLIFHRLYSLLLLVYF